jgi:hypothetical protein
MPRPARRDLTGDRSALAQQLLRERIPGSQPSQSRTIVPPPEALLDKKGDASITAP